MSLYEENFSHALHLMKAIDNGTNKDSYAMDKVETLLGVIPGGKQAFWDWRNVICTNALHIPSVKRLNDLYGNTQKRYFEKALSLMAKYDKNPDFGFIAEIRENLRYVEGGANAYNIWKRSSCYHPLEIEEVLELYLKLGGPDDLLEACRDAARA